MLSCFPVLPQLMSIRVGNHSNCLFTSFTLVDKWKIFIIS
ncbi:unnamed protein product [Schistosoma curassoni]|uniref:Uncharacterized protein n=1 Tax=Schistosoma curassoni TaxID=6186 RepID=A0A183KX90_9TREM|nr:unnamed protein product [Schistosoma curassoni]